MAVMNALPSCKVFCTLNITPELLLQIQNEYVAQGLCDYVITKTGELDSPNYRQIAFSSFFFENSEQTFYLYEKQS